MNLFIIYPKNVEPNLEHAGRVLIYNVNIVKGDSKEFSWQAMLDYFKESWTVFLASMFSLLE